MTSSSFLPAAQVPMLFENSLILLSALLLALLLLLALRHFRLRQNFMQAKAEQAKLQGYLNALQDEKEKRGQMKHEIKNEFENLANRIFDEQGKKFTDANQSLLKPLREQVGEFQRKVEAVHEKNLEDRSSLLTKLQELQNLNQQLSGDAKQLTIALKGSPQQRGAWGEMILQKVLEVSGLTEGREYELQHSVRKNGQNLRLDALIRLPRERDVVIDAKLALLKYNEAIGTESQSQKELYLKEHAKAIRSYIRDLSGKYLNLPGIRTLDATIMFIPIESAFAEALKVDPDLQDFAFQNNIVLAGPTTLFTHLKSIHIAWSAEQRESNIEKIIHEVNTFLNKIAGFGSDLEKVGERLKQARDTYEEAQKKLISGRGSVMSRAEKIKELGAFVTKKALPKASAELE